MTILFGDHLDIWKGELTNSCTCTKYDPITEEFTDEPSDDCFGDCWESAVDMFAGDTEALRKANTTGWWHVKDLNLWNREVSGYFHADKVADILRGMTVNSAWIMRYTVHGDHIAYSLSHHDSIGGSSALYPVSEEDVERIGLI